MKCRIQIQQKQATLDVKRLILFKNCQLVEAHGRSGQTYYLVFHKKRYINTVKVNQLNPDSFIAKAIMYGLIVNSPHHAIDTLVNQQTFSCIPLKKMLQSMSKKLDQLDQIIIITYFDQFISQEKIINLFIECFRQHRRDGQLQHAFQVLSTLKNYQPDNQFAHDMLVSLTFQGYQVHEREMFAFNPLDLDTLESIYQSDSRILERSILATVQLLKKFSNHYWQLFLSTLDPFPPSIRAATLYEMYLQQPKLINHQPFSDQLLMYVDSKRYLKILLEKDFSHQVNIKAFMSHLTQVEQNTHLTIFTKHQDQFIKRIDSFPCEEKEVVTRMIIDSALKYKPIEDILSWLDKFDTPFYFTKHLELIKELKENPDSQAQLADIYQYFNHFAGAIDCLKWEIELHPNNETLYKKLISLLKQNGQVEEAEAYQEQIIHQIKYS